MVKEYLGKEQIIEILNSKKGAEILNHRTFTAIKLISLVKEAPSADVEEVKHGEWIEHFSYGCWHYDCPFCDDGFATKEKCKTKPNYCGNCGAKMDGERKDT